MKFLKQITLADNLQDIEKVLQNTSDFEKERNEAIIEEALKNRLVYMAVAEEAELDQKMFQATSILNFSYNIEENFCKFAEKLKEIIVFDSVSLAIITEYAESYTNYAVVMQNGTTLYKKEQFASMENTAIFWISKERNPLIIEDLSTNRLFKEDEYLYKKWGFLSAVRIPLIDGKKVIGVLSLNSKTARQYSKKHLQVCKLLAAQITAIIKNTRLYENLVQKEAEFKIAQEKLKQINSVLEILAQQRSVQSLLQSAFMKILSIVNREVGAIYFIDDKKRKLNMVYSYGLSKGFCNQVASIEMGQGNTGKAAVIGKTIIVSDVNKNELIQGLHSNEGLLSACFIPLRAKKNVLGVMNIGSKSDKAFSREEIQTLETLSDYLAIFIERLKMLEKLTELASIDSLSGLYNRATFFKEFKTHIDRAQRYGERFSILMLDIDYFKQYNDTAGHIAGDRLIKKLGRIILNNVREGDIAARYGGEEFVILSYGTNSSEAFAQAERLRTTIQQKCKTQGVTISIGISSFPEDSIDGETLLKRADDALYAAKKCNRNCVKTYKNIAENT